LMIVFIVGCGNTPTGEVVRRETIKIGWAGPLTSSEAILGVSNLRGVELAIDEINRQGGINGKRIELVVEDTQESPKLTMNAFMKMKDLDKVEAVLTTSYDGLFGMAPIADEEKFPVINSLDTSEEIAEIGYSIFAVGIYDEGIGYTIADFVEGELQEEKVAIIYYNGAFFQLVKDSFTEKFEESGGEVVFSEAYEPESTDFRYILVKLKSKGINTFVFLGYDEAGLLIRQAKELGLDGNFIGIDTVTSSGFLENAGGAEEGMYFTFWKMEGNPVAEKVLAEYIVKYGEEPEAEIFTATGYDAMMVLAEALRSEKPLQQALYEVEDVPSITGNLSMSEDGVVRSIKEYMFQINNGEFVRLSN